LQCVAVCCSVLQCVAVCCCVLQCVAVCCSVLQCVAVYCAYARQMEKVWQRDIFAHTATSCNTRQRHRNTPTPEANHCYTRKRNCNTPTKEANEKEIRRLSHTATRCNTPQHTATHCNTPQHTATHCNTLQHTATHQDKKTMRRLITFFHSGIAVTHCCNTLLQHTAATHC